MSEQPSKGRAETIVLVAIERGFRRGAMVEPGAKFQWPADKPIPKWAVKEGDQKADQAKRIITAADLKPQALADAVKAKTEAMREFA
jgi:hypothetical protein